MAQTYLIVNEEKKQYFSPLFNEPGERDATLRLVWESEDTVRALTVLQGVGNTASADDWLVQDPLMGEWVGDATVFLGSTGAYGGRTTVEIDDDDEWRDLGPDLQKILAVQRDCDENRAAIDQFVQRESDNALDTVFAFISATKAKRWFRLDNGDIDRFVKKRASVRPAAAAAAADDGDDDDEDGAGDGAANEGGAGASRPRAVFVAGYTAATAAIRKFGSWAAFAQSVDKKRKDAETSSQWRETKRRLGQLATDLRAVFTSGKSDVMYKPESLAPFEFVLGQLEGLSGRRAPPPRLFDTVHQLALTMGWGSASPADDADQGKPADKKTRDVRDADVSAARTKLRKITLAMFEIASGLDAGWARMDADALRMVEILDFLELDQQIRLKVDYRMGGDLSLKRFRRARKWKMPVTFSFPDKQMLAEGVGPDKLAAAQKLVAELNERAAGLLQQYNQWIARNSTYRAMDGGVAELLEIMKERADDGDIRLPAWSELRDYLASRVEEFGTWSALARAPRGLFNPARQDDFQPVAGPDDDESEIEGRAADFAAARARIEELLGILVAKWAQYMKGDGGGGGGGGGEGRARPKRPRVQCELCDRDAGSACAGCRAAFYCSAECQAEHWTSGHRNVCE